MFLTYIGRELRRRRRQAIVVALGLALGIGLVVTVSAMAAGVRTAQAQVLHSLYAVGTDVTVTRPAKAGTGGPQRFGINPGDQSRQGQRFSRDRVFGTPSLAAMAAARVQSVASLPHVATASGGLSLEAIHLQGRFVRFQQGSSTGSGIAGSQPATRPSVPPINVAPYTIVGFDVTTPSVGAVNASQITAGRFFSAADANSAVAVVDQSYAKQKKLSVGSSVTIGGDSYTVIGIAAAPSGGSASDLYIPLAKAQKLTGMTGQVNRIYVKATSASQISAVKAEIQRILPKATVTTANDLASQVTGSLSSASSLAGHLGAWLSIVALVVAFAVASLLTLSAVGRRIREFGTLKALGWRSRRVVGQVMGEALVQGLIGGILGVGLGVGGAALVAHLSPTLTATVGGAASAASAAGPPGAVTVGGPVAQAMGSATHTVSVALGAPIHASILALAIGLAVAGGILAGSLGGWRAARLRPAEALRRVE